MVLSYSNYQDYPDTGRSTGAYIVFDQGGPIDNCADVPGPVSQSSAESEYNAECNTGMAPEHFGMLNNEFLNKNPYVVP